MLAESCNSTYQSMCELQCQKGFDGTGDPSYVCDVLNDGSLITWKAQEDTWRCERGTVVMMMCKIYKYNFGCLIFFMHALSSITLASYSLQLFDHYNRKAIWLLVAS